jgi:L-alanine-DL-glutamate epimerase-like enolase superfamily enzyme
MLSTATIRRVEVRAYTIPTDSVEADGTLTWDSTTIILVEVEAGDEMGLGYTYGHSAIREVVRHPLAGLLLGRGALDIAARHADMVTALRNSGGPGICASAIAALDIALWDLKAKLLGLPLAALFGAVRPEVAIYGSGGFTSQTVEQTQAQLGGWVAEQGCACVKMKIGGEPDIALIRMRAAREAIGDAGLMIDANGACSRKVALRIADAAAALGVIWFEEPVSSDDTEGLRLLRDRAPAPVEIAAGEYAYTPADFRHLLGAVDVLQADATRCRGYTGFLRAAALADAHGLPLSAHCAPALHLPVCCAAPRLRHIEWFNDHARLEAMLFDGAPVPQAGTIRPDLARPGHGLVFRRADAERFAV